MEKKYTSLKDVYLQESFGRSVPVPPRLRIIEKKKSNNVADSGIEPEKTIDIYKQDPNSTTPEYLGTVDNKGLVKISNIVQSETSGDVIKQLASVCNLSQVEEGISNIFNKYNIKWGELKRIYVDNKDNLTVLTPKFIGEEGTVNLREVFIKAIEYILEESRESNKPFEKFSSEADKLFNDLFKFIPMINGTATGEGEVLSILLSEGKKVISPEVKGDIVLPNKISIELKVGGTGRGAKITSGRQGQFIDARKKTEALANELASKNTPVTLDALKAALMSNKSVEGLLNDQDLNAVLPYINKSRNVLKIESLMCVPALIGYGRLGFTYLAIMNKEQVQNTKELNYYNARNLNVILKAINENKLRMYFENDGLTISGDTSGLGKAAKVGSAYYHLKKDLQKMRSGEKPENIEEPQASAQSEQPKDPNGPILLPPNKNIST